MVGLIDHIDPAVLDRVDVEHDSQIVPTGTAVFSPDRAHRYALARQWNVDRPPAVFIMLNPSTADAFDDDPTIRRCRNFARRWECGGLLVLNAFAARSPDPRTLRTHPDPVGPDNDAVFDAVFAAGPVGPVIVAWGADQTMLRSGRATQLVDRLHANGIEPLCLGQTKERHPLHPLYVRGDTEPVPYPDAGAYARATAGCRPTTRRPAPRPCESCPYRTDVPAGLWAPSEYVKLARYDAETGLQPARVFLCHQAGDRVCAGWAGCHDTDHLLSLRAAALTGSMTGDDITATRDYRSPVLLFRSGTEAAAWGMSGIECPDPAARHLQEKLLRRPGIRVADPPATMMEG